MYFLTKESPTHGQKSSQNFYVNFLLQYIDEFLIVYGPLKQDDYEVTGD